MNRPSEVDVEVEVGSGQPTRIHIGGSAQVVFRTEIALDSSARSAAAKRNADRASELRRRRRAGRPRPRSQFRHPVERERRAYAARGGSAAAAAAFPEAARRRSAIGCRRRSSRCGPM